MTIPVRPASERRTQIQDDAHSMGITEDYISLLVDEFYSRVRAHPALGPIFGEVIGNNWDPHLKRMKDFWSSVTMNTGRYSGKPVPAHQKLSTVTPGHFDVWLGLFEATLNETAPSPAAIGYFMERANRIAASLKLAMFGVPELEVAPSAVRGSELKQERRDQ